MINKMIEEDKRVMELSKMKQEQAKMDMIMSVNEKKEMLRRQKELEEYENEMLRRFAEQQMYREEEIKAKKAEVEAAREEIF